MGSGTTAKCPKADMSDRQPPTMIGVSFSQTNCGSIYKEMDKIRTTLSVVADVGVVTGFIMVAFQLQQNRWAIENGSV